MKDKILDLWRSSPRIANISILSGFLIGLYTFLSYPTFEEAILGLFLFNFLGFSLAKITILTQEHNSRLFYPLGIVVIASIAVLFYAQGSLGEYVSTSGTAKNPITGECVYEEFSMSSETKFPWYFKEGGCNLEKLCSEPVQKEQICNKLSSESCIAQLQGHKAAMNKSEVRKVPSSCFENNYSLTPELPDADPGDKMRKTENGLELVKD